MRLSPHFTLVEMTKSQVALRKSINNTPPAVAVEHLRALCVNVLEPVRKHFRSPVIVSSGYRSPMLNGAINGAPFSQHVRGQAADIEVLGVPNLDVWEWIRTSLVYDQLILEHHVPAEPFSGWVHVSYVVGKNRKAAFRLAP